MTEARTLDWTESGNIKKMSDGREDEALCRAKSRSCFFKPQAPVSGRVPEATRLDAQVRSLALIRSHAPVIKYWHPQPTLSPGQSAPEHLRQLAPGTECLRIISP